MCKSPQYLLSCSSRSVVLGEDPLLSGRVPLTHVKVDNIFMPVHTMSSGHMLQEVGLQRVETCH